MSNRRVFIDRVEFEPITGEELHFFVISGEERLPFCMSRATALEAAHSAISTVTKAAVGGLVLPFRGAG